MNTHREEIERVTIVGKIEDRSRAREYCQTEGFKIVHDSPHIISVERVDPQRFTIVAEKPNAS